MNPFDIYNVCLWYSGPKLLVSKVENICQLVSPFLLFLLFTLSSHSLHCHDISLLPALVLSFHAWFLIHFLASLAHSKLSCLLDCSPQVIGSFASFHTVSVVFSMVGSLLYFLYLVFSLCTLALKERIQSYILSLLHGLWYNYVLNLYFFPYILSHISTWYLTNILNSIFSTFVNSMSNYPLLKNESTIDLFMHISWCHLWLPSFIFTSSLIRHQFLWVFTSQYFCVLYQYCCR